MASGRARGETAPARGRTRMWEWGRRWSREGRQWQRQRQRRRQCRLLWVFAVVYAFASALSSSKPRRSLVASTTGMVSGAMEGGGGRPQTATFPGITVPADFWSQAIKLGRQLNHSRLQYSEGPLFESNTGSGAEVQNATALLTKDMIGNCAPTFFPGCVFAHHDAPWLVESRLLGDEEISRCITAGVDKDTILLNPDSLELTALNLLDEEKVIFVSVMYPILCGLDTLLPMGEFQRENDSSRFSTTMILTLRPRSCMKLGTIALDGEYKEMNPEELEIVAFGSKKRVPRPMARTRCHRRYQFPLSDSNGPYLCIQGHNGSMTHFEAPNLYAVDFLCPVGTEILAIGDGVIEDVQTGESGWGCNVEFLFRWNSMRIRLDDGHFVDYVHIKGTKAGIKIGDRVKAGDVIGYSGNVGFAPRPHLHIELHKGSSAEDPSIPIEFVSQSGSFTPKAGLYYDSMGPISGRSWMLEAAESVSEEEGNAQDQEPEIIPMAVEGGEPVPFRVE